MTTDDAVPVINREVALQRLCGDTAMLATLAGFFLEDAPQLMKELCEAHETNSLDTVYRKAHALKGLAGTFEAFPFRRLAEEVESLAKSAQVIPLTDKIATMQTEFDRLVTHLRREVNSSS